MTKYASTTNVSVEKSRAEIRALRNGLDMAEKVIQAAKRYRAEEQDGTPRLWRGKKLHDLGLRLDKAITVYEEHCGEVPLSRPMIGLFAQLTPEQQAAALSYDGPDTDGFGPPDGPRVKEG